MERGSQTRGYLHGASNFPAHVEDSSPPSARCLPKDSISRTELPLAPEMFAKLRAGGIPRHAIPAGREVLLDEANRLRIHKLARAYDLPFARSVPRCRHCSPQEATEKE